MQKDTTVEKKQRLVSRVPAYRRIEEDLRAQMRDGRLPAGAMLAGRHHLAREYGVALSTIQQAVANLIADHFLETQNRRGTFVTRTLARSGGTLPPAAKNGIVPAVERTSATLGIVATARIDLAASPDVGSLWARLAMRSLEQVFSAAGGTTRFLERYPESRGPYPRGSNESNAFSISEAITMLRAEGADALVIIGLCDAEDMSDEVVRTVDVEQVPTVYVSWHEVQPPLAQVFYDNRFAGYQAAQHLLRQGYRQLTFLAPFADMWLRERIEGARNAVRHAHFPEETLCLYPAQTPPEAYDRRFSGEQMRSLARTAFAQGWKALHPSGSGLPGFIAPNDETAYAVLDAAAEHGLRAGRDFGLVGFDDDPRASAAGLTTVRPPVEAMGEEAGRLLLRALQGGKQGHLVRLRSHLIPRASTLLRLK